MSQYQRQPHNVPRPATARGGSWFRVITMSLPLILALAACGAPSNVSLAARDRSTETGVNLDDAFSRGLLLKTRMNIPEGAVHGGSTINGLPFCRGGTIKDQHGSEKLGASVDRTITCSDGTLRMGFSPQELVGNTQSGPWEIISGTGAYESWRGQGAMTMTYDRRRGGARLTQGRETFTGCVAGVD